MKFHQPEYDFLFSTCAMRFVCRHNALRRITIRPSDIEGFWHVERWTDGSIESTRRPMRADGLSYFLKRWGFPAERTAWEALVDEEVHSEDGERSEPADIAMLRAYRVVYFLKAGPFIKIGFTAGPLRARIEQLKTGCPYEIQPLATISGDHRTERDLHRRFRKHRANLEWFHATDEILSFVEGYANAA